MYYEAVVSRVNFRNQNGRCYPEAVMTKAIAAISPRFDRGSLIGSLDHSDMQLQSAACIWRGIEIRPDGAVVGRFECMDTPAGDTLRKLLDTAAVGFSTRGSGTGRHPTSEEAEAYGEDCVVIDDYRLISIDPVLDPSVPEAKHWPAPRKPTPTSKDSFQSAELFEVYGQAEFLSDSVTDDRGVVDQEDGRSITATIAECLNPAPKQGESGDLIAELARQEKAPSPQPDPFVDAMARGAL